LKFTIAFALHYRVGITHWDEMELLKEFKYIYEKLGDNEEGEWDLVIERVALGSIKDVTQKYEAFDFFRNREEIGRNVEVNLRKSLKEFGFDLINCLMLDVGVQGGFDTAIKATEVVRQRQDQYIHRMESEEIQGQTKVKQEEINRTI